MRTEMECGLGDMPSCGDRNEAAIKQAARKQLAGKENYRTEQRGQPRQIQQEERGRGHTIIQSLPSNVAFHVPGTVLGSLHVSFKSYNSEWSKSGSPFYMNRDSGYRNNLR